MDETRSSAALVERIRLAMKARGVSQDSLVQLTGIPQATLSRRLTGRVSFTVDEVYAISEALGVPVSEFLGVAV